MWSYIDYSLSNKMCFNPHQIWVWCLLKPIHILLKNSIHTIGLLYTSTNKICPLMFPCKQPSCKDLPEHICANIVQIKEQQTRLQAHQWKNPGNLRYYLSVSSSVEGQLKSTEIIWTMRNKSPTIYFQWWVNKHSKYQEFWPSHWSTNPSRLWEFISDTIYTTINFLLLFY